MEEFTALEQQELMKDEIEKSYQINNLENLHKEKIEYMNTVQEWDQEQLRIFQEIPNSQGLTFIQDQTEQRNQINEIEKWEEAKKQHIHDAQEWDQGTDTHLSRNS